MIKRILFYFRFRKFKFSQCRHLCLFCKYFNQCSPEIEYLGELEGKKVEIMKHIKMDIELIKRINRWAYVYDMSFDEFVNERMKVIVNDLEDIYLTGKM